MDKHDPSISDQKSLTAAGEKFSKLTPKVGDIFEVECYTPTPEGGQEGVRILIEIIRTIDSTHFEIRSLKKHFPYSPISKKILYLVMKGGWVVIGNSNRVFPVVSIQLVNTYIEKTTLSVRSFVQGILVGKEYIRPEKGDILICDPVIGEKYQVTRVSEQSIFLEREGEQYIIFEWKMGEKRVLGGYPSFV